MFTAIVLLLSLFNIATSSDLATFTDSKCSASLNDIDGPNGYPNGTCTKLELASNQSFQIVGLDKGCAATLYGPDTTDDPCSANILIIGSIGECYNSTWKYYSLDGCDIPAVTPSATPLPATSSLSTSTISTAVSSTSAAASSSPVKKNNHVPLIVGATLGSVAVVALIFIAALLLLRHRKSNARAQPQPPTHELSNDRAVLEATQGEKAAQSELWAQEPAQEIGRNSMHIPAVELPGHSVGGAGLDSKTWPRS